MDYVYVRADEIHVNIRLEEHKMIGVRADGRKELITLADGYRESAESAVRLRPPRHARPGAGRRGRRTGSWSALREVFRKTAEQRCWFRKTAKVLAALPRSARPGAKKALAGRGGQGSRAGRGEGVRGGLQGKVPQGGREDHRRAGPTAGVL